MHTPKCPDHFAGSISLFIEQFAAETFLASGAVERAQRLVAEAMERSDPLLVRNFGSYQRAAEGYRTADGKRSFVVGDNEPVVWFWRHLHEGRPVDLTAALCDQALPISMSPDRDEDARNWATWGNGDRNRANERWRGVNGGRWKLCHIFQAAPAHLDDSEPGLTARFVRNFHPLNHFWFASEYVWKNHGRFVMSPEPRLGESTAVCMAFWREYCARYPSEANWFMSAAGLNSSELDAAKSTRDPTVEFKWEPDEGMGPDSVERPFHPRTETIPGRGLVADRANVCIIRETSEGRFHLGHFGKSIGGQDRDVPFKFRVIDVTGRLLAESAPATAAELGIAVVGRGDYDGDNYRQRDFMRREAGKALVPHQALARRVPGWKYF